jgi:hypothetical protein
MRTSWPDELGRPARHLRPCNKCDTLAAFSLCTICAALYRVLPIMFGERDHWLDTSYRLRMWNEAVDRRNRAMRRRENHD